MRGGLTRWLAVTALLGIVAAGVIYRLIFVTGGTGEASEPISAPQLALPTATATPEAPAPTATAGPTAAATVQAAAPTATPEATEAPTAAPGPTDTPRPTATAAGTAAATEAPASGVPTSAVLFRIVPEESEVRFEIDEILRGAPTLVVGTTNQIAGDFIVDFANLGASELGTLRINVRTLRTPEDRRDRAIRSRILESASDEFEFITFEPVNLVGLPESAPFQIVGNLTIRNITREVTFDAELTLAAPDRVEGTAVTVIQRPDYNLTIPSVPFVASVDEDVLLGITFVAVAVPQ